MREMALKKGSFTGNKHTGGLNMEITLEQLNEKIDNLSRLTLISSKTVLDFEETILFTGLSKGHLYRLTSNREIPYFKKNRKLYFKNLNWKNGCLTSAFRQKMKSKVRRQLIWQPINNTAMNNRTANIFDAWIINQHNRLKERIASSTMFDDDAFQETYLTMREALTIKDIELDFEPVFIKLYRRMLARELSTEFRYSHPDPLFFVLLRYDEENPEEVGTSPDREIQAKQVDEYVRYNFKPSDYLIFHLKFFQAMTWQGLIDYTGQSSATIAKRLNNMKHAVKQRFTPPVYNIS